MIFRNKKEPTPNINIPHNTSDVSNEELQTNNDLGFGEKLGSHVRLINKRGEFNVIRRGKHNKQNNLYIWLVTSSWFYFMLVVFAYYILSNAVFACMHLMVGIETLSPGQSQGIGHDFWTAFFFSVQTFTTVGYGSISPISTGSNIIASINALYGLMSFALATGLFYARFSRPTSSIIFSENALIAPYQDGKAFMFRIANSRKNELLDVEATVSMTWVYRNAAGEIKRNYRGLKLERKAVPMFPLNWTIVHPVDQKSPLYERSMDDLKEMDVEFIIRIKGFDDTFAQVIYEHYSYKYIDLVYNARFNPMYFVDEKEGHTVLELEKVNSFERC